MLYRCSTCQALPILCLRFHCFTHHKCAKHPTIVVRYSKPSVKHHAIWFEYTTLGIDLREAYKFQAMPAVRTPHTFMLNVAHPFSLSLSRSNMNSNKKKIDRTWISHQYNILELLFLTVSNANRTFRNDDRQLLDVPQLDITKDKFIETVMQNRD